MSKSNERLSVHLRVYRGKALTYNAKGECTNEQNLVKLEYNTAEYTRFLNMLRANGFIKAEVEKVLDLSEKTEGKSKNDPRYYKELEKNEIEIFQKEVDAALNPDGNEKELTADQKQIAELTARLNALESDKKEVKVIKVNDSKDVKSETKENKKELTADEKTELDEARKKYVELYGKKGHNGWDLAEINKRIAEFKPGIK